MNDRMFDITDLADWELSWEVDLAKQQLHSMLGELCPYEELKAA